MRAGCMKQKPLRCSSSLPISTAKAKCAPFPRSCSMIPDRHCLKNLLCYRISPPASWAMQPLPARVCKQSHGRMRVLQAACEACACLRLHADVWHHTQLHLLPHCKQPICAARRTCTTRGSFARASGPTTSFTTGTSRHPAMRHRPSAATTSSMMLRASASSLSSSGRNSMPTLRAGPTRFSRQNSLTRSDVKSVWLS